jgi:hypothetical protein
MFRVLSLTLLFIGLCSSIPVRAEEDCDACTDEGRRQELAYLRGAIKVAWDLYKRLHPGAGHGWVGNAEQTGLDIINAIATLPGKVISVVVNTTSGQNILYVKSGPNLGVRCQDVFDGMISVIQAELRKTGHKFRCYRLAHIIQDGVGGSSRFNHVYFGVTDFSKSAGPIRRSMGDILYFADPWSDGMGTLVPGIGYVPRGSWLGKSVDLGAYQGYEMPREGEAGDCGPRNLCANQIAGKYVFHLSSSSWGDTTESAYSFNPETYLGQLAAWDYLSPLNGNPYALLYAVPVQVINGSPTRVKDFAGGSWRIVQYLSTTMDPATYMYSDYGLTVVAGGSLDERAFFVGLPQSVDRMVPARSSPEAPGVSMATATTLEVTCTGSWPVVR